MSDPINNHDLVDQAVAELRDMPIPDGPSPALAAQTLAALTQKPADHHKPSCIARIQSIGLIYKVAAVLAIALCGVAVVVIVDRIGGGTIASADVAARKLREARTLTCTWTMDMPSSKLPVSMKMMFMEPGRLRVEIPGTAISILDSSKNKLLVLSPLMMTAINVDLATVKPGPPNQASDMADWIEKIKNTSGQDAQTIGTQEIDGVEARGFLLSEQGMHYTVWANAKTGTPLRIEFPIDLSGLKTTVVMSDLVFDQPIADSMFDINPPPGYRLMNFDMPVLLGAPGEDDVLEALRWYSQKSPGQFPKSLDRWTDFFKIGRQAAQRPDQKEMMGVIARVGRATVFFTTLGSENYGYLGADVKLGEKDKIIFWYRQGGSEDYRAIFADLRIENVTRQQIPANQ